MGPNWAKYARIHPGPIFLWLPSNTSLGKRKVPRIFSFFTCFTFFFNSSFRVPTNEACSKLRSLVFVFLYCVPAGVQVRHAASSGLSSTHACVWCRPEACRRCRGAGCARAPRLAANWVAHSGLCPRSLPHWVSVEQVKSNSADVFEAIWTGWNLFID